jgi:hypothetical protein
MRRKGRLRSPFLFATCDRRHGAHPPVVLNILATDQLEGADVSGVIGEGGERLGVFLDGSTRATWRDHQRMLAEFTTLRRSNLSRSNEGQRSPHATSSRQLRKRLRAMRSIAPSSCAE